MVKEKVEWSEWENLRYIYISMYLYLYIYLYVFIYVCIVACVGTRGFKVWQKVPEIGKKIVKMIGKQRLRS